MRQLIGYLCAGVLVAQVPNPTQQQVSTGADRTIQPIYRVDVIQRTIKAINYGHRTLPTKVDMKGTVLMPKAFGEGTVQSKRGAAEVEVKVENLSAPTRFGHEYLTYVLWAITPEGRPVNLGELIVDTGNKAKLKVSADLQAFALMVTAEPYFAVTQPSDVVVLENMVRPDTVGLVEEVVAKYELLPRGRYTYEPPAQSVPAKTSAEAGTLSMEEYEAVLAVYQAMNAIQIARAAGADREATDVLRKAENLFDQARALQSHKGSSRQVVTMARQAAQTAEDARAVTVKRQSPAPTQ